mmetsp:Transcript_18209/g.52607  ORF Transcript_18209/g.52607 Transcript_18209/m.52607 type:complete len:297 (+) Transcript_18209:368-1258(+)
MVDANGRDRPRGCGLLHGGSRSSTAWRQDALPPSDGATAKGNMRPVVLLRRRARRAVSRLLRRSLRVVTKLHVRRRPMLRLRSALRLRRGPVLRLRRRPIVSLQMWPMLRLVLWSPLRRHLPGRRCTILLLLMMLMLMLLMRMLLLMLLRLLLLPWLRHLPLGLLSLLQWWLVLRLVLLLPRRHAPLRGARSCRRRCDGHAGGSASRERGRRHGPRGRRHRARRHDRGERPLNARIGCRLREVLHAHSGHPAFGTQGIRPRRWRRRCSTRSKRIGVASAVLVRVAWPRSCGHRGRR